MLMPHAEPAAGGNRGQWELPGVKAPHSLTVTAGPMRLADTARPVAVLVGETQPQGSRLHKFIILPAGAASPLSSKRRHWQRRVCVHEAKCMWMGRNGKAGRVRGS